MNVRLASNKKVSIAIATYNGEKYIEEQINSIINQTYANLEIIIVDDCSTDNTFTLLRKYKKYKNITVHQNTYNVGFVKSFEKAVSLCGGDYIALADQDDVWEKDKIAVLVSEIGDYSLIYSDARLINRHGELICDSYVKFSGLPVQTGKPCTLLIFRNIVTGCLTMFKREILLKALPVPDESFGVLFHDWWFALVASKMNGIKYIDEKLVQYRQHECNLFGAKSKTGIVEKCRKIVKIRNNGAFRDMVFRLNNMGTLSIFDDTDRAVINDRMTFYDDLLNSRIHYKSFKIAYKYRNYLIHNESILYRSAFMLGALLG